MQTCCAPGTRFALVVLLSILSGCRSSEMKSVPAPLARLNLILVTIDTLRADRLGCYGYSLAETPNLDRLAKRGVLFESAIAQAPLTAPSHASMMTGVYPTVHKVRDTGGFVLSPSHTTLASILQAQGWDTAAFVGSSVLKRRFGLNRGFALYDDDMGTQVPDMTRERRAGDVVDRALRWLRSRSGKPFFLWVHVYDPHFPYEPPSPFREKYRARPYDGEVAYTDRELGRLFDASGQDPNTLIAVLSDHGESFSEHGEYAHGVFLYDTTLRIAFLMAGPRITAGTRIKQQARTIDLLPTVLDLMGGAAPEGVQGASLVPALSGTPNTATWSYVETLFPKLNMGWAELRGVRTNRWKYIRAPKPELYDLAADPGETLNVFANHPVEVRDLEANLRSVAKSGRTGDPEKVAGTGVDPRTRAELRSLGYLGGSPEREYKLTGKGTDPKDRVGVLKLLHLAVYSGEETPLPRRIDLLRQAIAEDPANPTLYSSLGDVYRDARRSNDEIALYREALEKGVQFAGLYSRLGSLYLKQGNKREAIPLLEAAAQLNPYDHASLQNLASAYRESGRLPDADRVLRSIVDSGEEYAPAYNELGMVSFQKGDVAAARGYFEKAAQLDPKYQLNLGRLYKMAGDNTRARACFQAFLAAKSADAEYRSLIPQVQKELAQTP